MSISSLTFNGIKQVVTSATNLPTILQVINLQPEQKMIDGGKSFVSQISDGHTKIRCYWNNSVYNKILEIGKNEFNGSIVKLNTYVATPKNVMVIDFEQIYEMGDVIGSPINYKDYSVSQTNTKPASSSVPDQRSIDKFQNQNKPFYSNNKPIVSIPPNTSTQRVQITDPSNYESIQVLYAGFNNWALYCRVTKVNYKDFINSKKTQTRLLQFQIKDRKDWTIKCTIFGNEAERMKNIIKPGEVFTFSQGIIKPDTYKKPSHQKDSSFTITFTEHSKIQLAVDNDTISQAKEDIMKLQNIPKYSPGIEVDVIGILKQIGPEKQFQIKSSGESSSKRVIVICDPISKVECDVTLWRDQLQIKDESKLKVLKFESFKTHEYQGRYSLSAWRKSKIIEINDHPFKKYETQVMKMNFDSISYRKNNSEVKSNNISSVKQLLLESQSIQEGDTLWSTFRVYLNQIKVLGKKWYEGCPHCRKSVNPGQTQCGSCQKSFDTPSLRYILNVQISDSLGTGSIWTTAHDDFANKIFSYIENLPASKASKMNDQQFSQFCYKCLFQQFKVTITSKMQTNPHDFTRRVKHQVSTFLPLQYVQEAKNNLDRIRTMCL